jgi:uncharacterized protein
MRAVIIGATGFIGRELIQMIQQAGHKPVGITRDLVKARQILGSTVELAEWDGQTAEDLVAILSGADAIINLAGENIASGRWTGRRKQRIRESRIRTGRLLAEAVSLSTEKPSVLIQGSATGIYGTPADLPTGEQQPAGKGFLAELTRDWESSIEPLKKEIGRVVIVRTGLVLGKDGGLLKKLLLPFQFYCGTIFGSGKQWMSWIHFRDEAAAILFLLENKNSSGPFNLAAPGAVQMQTFIMTISETIRKPVWIRMPGIVLKTALGEMAEETILSSQNISPEKLLNEGFHFQYPDLPGALKNLLLLK